jgi:TPR repeat
VQPSRIESLCNPGNLLTALGQTERAIAVFRQALALAPALPDARLGHGIALPTAGRQREGWPGFEWRWCIPGFPARSFAQPQCRRSAQPRGGGCRFTGAVGRIGSSRLTRELREILLAELRLVPHALARHLLLAELHATDLAGDGFRQVGEGDTAHALIG